ncbi:unnamed protein product [Agarophyton chilense]
MPVSPPSSAQLYASLSLLFATILLHASVRDDHPHAIARAALQLVTAVALLPACRRVPRGSPLRFRWPVLAAFLVCLALLVDAVLRVLTALEVLFYDLSRVVFRLHPFIVLSRLLVTLSAVFTLRALVAPPSGKHAAVPHTAIRAMYIHAVAATLANSSDAIGLLAHSAIPSAIFDTFASIFTILVVIPQFRHTTRILMHAAPYGIASTIGTRREAVMKLEGVLQCGDIHIWEEGEGLIVGTICVLVDVHVSKSWVLERTARAFDGIVDDLTIQVESSRPEDEHRRL